MYGERIRKLRKKAGLSQAELAEKTGVSRPNISFWENADFPPLEGIDRVCRALSMELWKFFATDETLSSVNGVADEFAGIIREIALMDEGSRRDIREIMGLIVYKYRQNAESRREREGLGTADGPAIPDADADNYRMNAPAGTALGTAVEDYMRRFMWLTSPDVEKPGKIQ
jgi:transcriptional regulator with XRE-family HTH domain